MNNVYDMNGVLITSGCIVKVHQEDGVRLAVVKDDFTYNPETEKYKGNWVDIDSGEGCEGMMSYILSVYDTESCHKSNEYSLDK